MAHAVAFGAPSRIETHLELGANLARIGDTRDMLGFN